MRSAINGSCKQADIARLGGANESVGGEVSDRRDVQIAEELAGSGLVGNVGVVNDMVALTEDAREGET